MRWIASGALALAFLIAPVELSALSQNRARAERDGGCRYLRVRGRQEDGRLRRRRFSATEILDLELVVGFPAALSGEHRVDVKIYTPDEHLYRVLTVVFRVPETPDGAPVSRGASRKKLPGAARPLDVQQAELLRGGRGSFVRTSLPVAGTSIITSSLYGRWSAVAHLDGSDASCLAPRPFVITQ